MKRIRMVELLSNSQGVSPETDTKKNIADQKIPLIIEEESISDPVIVGEDYKDGMQEIPICAEDGLYLSPTNTCNSQRYGDLFAKVWSNIPKSDRLSLLKHWRKYEWLFPDRAPSIELVDVIVDGVKREKWDSDATFIIHKHAYILSFDAAKVDDLSDAELETEIACQLAYVMWIMNYPGTRPGSSTCRFHTLYIQEMMKHWGYTKDEFSTRGGWGFEYSDEWFVSSGGYSEVDDEIIGKNDQEQEVDIPICANENMYLISLYTSTAQRFANLFAEVWASIPSTERKYMCDFWYLENEMRPNPTIEMVDQVESSPNHQSFNPYYIKFNAAMVDELSDLELKTLVAYQMADSIIHMDRFYWSLISPTRIFCPSHTSDLMRDWGYKDDVLSETKSRFILSGFTEC